MPVMPLRIGETWVVLHLDLRRSEVWDRRDVKAIHRLHACLNEPYVLLRHRPAQYLAVRCAFRPKRYF